MANFKGVPTPIIKRQGIDLKAKSGVIRGNVCLQLKDALTGKIKEEIRGHNMLTNGINSALNGCPYDLNKLDGSNDNNAQGFYYTPIYEKLLGGLILFPQSLGNDPDLLFPPFTNMPTGYASCDSYQQGDPKQGAYDAVSSGIITNGFRHVFSWGSAFGNGQIASLGLAPKQCEGWCKDITKKTLPSEALDSGYGALLDPSAIPVAICAKGILMAGAVDDGNRSTILAFYGNYRPHNISLVQSTFRNATWFDYHSDGVPYKHFPYDNDHRRGYTWGVRIPSLPEGYNLGNLWNQYNFEIIGDYVYVILHYKEQGIHKFAVTKLDIADGSTVETNTYTFNANFADTITAVYYNGFIYAGAATAGTIYKCECSTGLVVSEITDASIPAGANLRYTGGTWMYNSYFTVDLTCDLLVAHTGSHYNWATGRWYSDDSYGGTRPIWDDGMWLISGTSSRSGYHLEANIKQWGLMSHFDLQTAVQKTVDKQLTVTYTLTQA